MKKQLMIVIPLIVMLILAVSPGCSKVDEGGNNNNPTDKDLLTAHSWTSYKVLNGGTDVTSSITPMTINFNSNGSFTASGIGTASGNWSLSGNSLSLGNAGTWTVLQLTSSTLKIRDSSGFVEAHFN